MGNNTYVLYFWRMLSNSSYSWIFSLRSPSLDQFNLFIILIFSLDILINFNTVFFLNGKLIDEHKKIPCKYLKTWFLIDFISAFPFDQFINLFSSDQTNNLQLLRLFKIFRLARLARLLHILRLKRILSMIYHYLAFSKAVLTFLDLLKLWLTLMLIAHWLCCGFHFLSGDDDLDLSMWIN